MSSIFSKVKGYVFWERITPLERQISNVECAIAARNRDFLNLSNYFVDPYTDDFNEFEWVAMHVEKGIQALEKKKRELLARKKLLLEKGVAGEEKRLVARYSGFKKVAYVASSLIVAATTYFFADAYFSGKNQPVTRPNNVVEQVVREPNGNFEGNGLEKIVSGAPVFDVAEDVAGGRELAGESARGPEIKIDYQPRQIEVDARKGWGLTRYAAVSSGLIDLEKMINMSGRERDGFFGTMTRENRVVLRGELDRLYGLNKDNPGFRRNDPNYIASDAKILFGLPTSHEEYELLAGRLGVKPAIRQEVATGERREEGAAAKKIEEEKRDERPEWKRAWETNKQRNECRTIANVGARQFTCYYLGSDRTNPGAVGLYGRSYNALNKILENYGGNNNTQYLASSVVDLFENITAESHGKYRVKMPGKGIDRAKVAGVWKTKTYVTGVVSALRADVQHSKLSETDKGFVLDIVSSYERNLGL